MIVIGVLLVVIAAGAVALVLMAPAAMSNVIELSAIGVTVRASPLALFVAGAVSLALFALGFPMITQGIRRKVRTRRELHQLRKEQATARPGTAPPAGPGTTTPAGPGTTTPAGPGTTTPAGPGTTTPAGPGTAKPAGPGTTTPTDPSTATAAGEHSTRRDDPQAGGSTHTSSPGT